MWKEIIARAEIHVIVVAIRYAYSEQTERTRKYVLETCLGFTKADTSQLYNWSLSMLL